MTQISFLMLFYLVICSQVHVSSPFSALMDIKERTWNDHVSRIREALVDHNKHIILDKHSVFMSLYSFEVFWTGQSVVLCFGAPAIATPKSPAP